MAFIYSYPILRLFYSIVFLCSSYPPSHATDTLSQGQSVQDGQTLVSAGKVFELGFFSPGKSTNRYVGIWYYNISTQTVVWVANREASLQNSDGSFRLGSDGKLSVVDGKGNTMWSQANSSSVASDTAVQLLDSGNLVLQASDGTVFWQSFDHPTDTFLPGMKLSVNKTTGKGSRYTSWKSLDDPSPGNYSTGLDPDGSVQGVIWEGKVPRWRNGPWAGQYFVGTVNRPQYIYGLSLVDNQDMMYFTYNPRNGTLQRFQMQWNGVENGTLLVEETKEWESFWAQPVKECEFYGKCGVNGKCSNGDTPICSCLKGFQPKSSDEWSRGNWSGGCVRRTPLGCELNKSGDGFFRLERLKLSDHSDWASSDLNEAQCESFCLKNCSCKAYAFISGTRCMTWGSDLIDIYQFPEGVADLYIKLAGSELRSSSKRRILFATVPALATVILMSLILLLLKHRTTVKEWLKKSREVKQDLLGSELPFFTFVCLAFATDDFSDSNKLGEGGFGPVYKGALQGGQQIAVKRLSKNSGQGLEEFKNEVILIAKLQHRNLVKIFGCCVQGEEKMLVYEYMSNKSLDAFLFDTTNQKSLDWKKRFNIIEGIARGLVYLHRDSRLRIVHRDLKASNILLDKDMNPKISDFGMARIFGGDQNQANTNRIVGTIGYMSPEYAIRGLFSVKSDVYSFGIIVLEILTGLRNASFHHIESSSIVGYAWQLWNEDRAMDMIDPSIRMSCSINQVQRCVQIALLCVQDRVNERPDMSSVILMISSETGTVPRPKQPKFALQGQLNEMETISRKNMSPSSNDCTMTVLQGR